jgi:lipopolysaccharide transport system ATP-binding protein
MSQPIIEVNNISKLYRLGSVGTGTLRDDAIRWWNKIQGKEDPFLSIAQENDRATKALSDYVWSLKDVSFQVERGDILGIVGRNGAGKSTLLKILSRITAPTSGLVHMRGRVASLLEVGTGFHPELTGRENIYLNGAILGMKKDEIRSKLDEIIAFSSIERYIDTPVKRYSSGMYVRLAFAVAAHLDPEILIIDEVLAVGDVEFQEKCLGKIKDISTTGRTVLFVSHNMAAVQNLCNKGILLEHGKLVYSGTASETVQKYMSKNIDGKASREIIIQPSHRPNNLLLESEILSVGFIHSYPTNEFSTDEPISINMRLKGNRDCNNFRFAFGIYSMDDRGVASYFGPSTCSIRVNELKEFNLTIHNHQLAKGKYYLNFAVGKGNEVTGVREFDIVMKTLFFEIGFSDIHHQNRISMWDEMGWGHINLQNVIIKEHS